MRQVIACPILLTLLLILSGCNAPSDNKAVKTTGKACLGQNADSLVESLKNQCEAGDIVATKHPAYFCDFNHSIVFNSYDSAICVYAGKQKAERTAD